MKALHFFIVISSIIILILLVVLVVSVWFVDEDALPAPKQCQYVILRNFNPEGGFWWMIYNVLHAAHFAEQTGMKLVVLFDSGLYVEKESAYQKEMERFTSTNNWFEYFFEPLGDVQVQKQVKNLQLLPSASTYATNRTARYYAWEHSAFETRDMTQAQLYKTQWDRVIRVRQHVTDEIEEFAAENFPRGHTLIGIHYRGTDKYGNKTSTEDGPIHYEYSFCAQAVRDWMKMHVNLKPFTVFACSDEDPFIEYMKLQLTEVNVVATNSIRSDFSTSGLHLKSELCPDNYAGNEYKELPDCRMYRLMKEKSVHRGKYSGPRRRLGQDALKDVLLLTKCRVFLRSAGNLSNFVKYLNPNIEEIHMNVLYVNRQNR